MANFTRELAKVAKLSSVQAGLPGAMSGLPSLAIAAGSKLAKVTGGKNIVESRLLGMDENIRLPRIDLPAPSAATVTRNQGAQGQSLISCNICRRQSHVTRYSWWKNAGPHFQALTHHLPTRPFYLQRSLHRHTNGNG